MTEDQRKRWEAACGEARLVETWEHIIMPVSLVLAANAELEALRRRVEELEAAEHRLTTGTIRASCSSGASGAPGFEEEERC